jgi:hypothetical protein
MAKTVKVFLTCDLHKENEQVDGAASVAFGYDSKLFELDLCRDHLAEYTEALGPWAEVARAYGSYGGPEEPDGRRSGRRRSGSSVKGTSKELAAIREWARGQGMEVSDRGRISASVREAYEKAN